MFGRKIFAHDGHVGMMSIFKTRTSHTCRRQGQMFLHQQSQLVVHAPFACTAFIEFVDVDRPHFSLFACINQYIASNLYYHGTHRDYHNRNQQHASKYPSMLDVNTKVDDSRFIFFCSHIFRMKIISFMWLTRRKHVHHSQNEPPA